MNYNTEDLNYLDEKLMKDFAKKISISQLSQISKGLTDDDPNDAINVQIDVTDVGLLRPVDGGWGWMIVIGSFLVMFLLDGICLSYGLFLSALENSFENVPKMQMMFAGSLITGCYLIMGPVASALSNQYGFRTLVIAGSIISSASMFISTFTYNITAFVLIYGLGGGIGFSLIFLPGCTIIALWFERYRATATGIAICGSGCGAAAFSVLIPYLIEQYSWRGCLIILAALNCNCLVAAALFRPMKSHPPKIILLPPPEHVMTDDKIEQMISELAKKTVQHDRGLETQKDMAQISTNHLIDLVIRKKERDRAKSTGSLNNMIITSDNKLVEASPDINTQQVINMEMIRDIVTKYLDKQESKRLRKFQSNVNLFTSNKRNSFTQSQNSMSGSCLIASQPQLVSSGNFFRSVISLRPSADHNIPVNKDIAKKLSQKLSTELSRPLLKADLYYAGSVQHLNNENIQFIGSQYTIQDQKKEVPNGIKSPILMALHQLMDVSILRSWTVQISLLSNFIGMFGFLIPFQFLVSHASLNGLEEMKSATLLTILGLASCVGRIMSGCIADFKWANCLVIHNACLVIAGIDTMLLPLMTTYTDLVIFVLVYAFSTAAVVSLKTIVIVDIMGTEKLTNIFGWTILAQGIAILFGPPLLGSFYDLVQNYSYTFILGGGLLSLSGILGAPLRAVARLELKRKGIFVLTKPSFQIHMSPNAENVEFLTN